MRRSPVRKKPSISTLPARSAGGCFFFQSAYASGRIPHKPQHGEQQHGPKQDALHPGYKIQQLVGNLIERRKVGQIGVGLCGDGALAVQITLPFFSLVGPGDGKYLGRFGLLEENEHLDLVKKIYRW